MVSHSVSCYDHICRLAHWYLWGLSEG